MAQTRALYAERAATLAAEGEAVALYDLAHPCHAGRDIVGRDNVLASNDCGFATSAAGDEVNKEVAWAKLDALVEGARIASARLWPRSAAA